MTYSGRLVFWGACLGMFTHGIVMTVLGSILPAVVAHFGVGKAEAGSLFVSLSVGVFGGSVVFGPVVDRYGYRGLLLACAGLVLAGLQGIAFAPTFAALGGAVVLIGLGGGGLNGATNALVADVSGEERGVRLSLLGVFFGVGACGVPFAIGFLFDHFTYRAVVAGLGALVLVPLLWYAAVRFPAPKHARGFPLAQGARLLREPALLLLGLLLFFEGGIEMVVGGWTTTYFIEELSMAPHDAPFVLALFWAGMIAARLWLGRLLRTRTPAAVLRAFLALGVGAALLLLVATPLWLAAAAVLLLGVGLSATFPVVYSYTSHAYAHLTGTAFGLLLVLSIVGSSLFSYGAGLLGEAAGLRAAFVLLPVGLVAILLVLHAVLRRLPHARAT